MRSKLLAAAACLLTAMSAVAQSDDITMKSQKEIACRLTTPELQKRKQTIIKTLKARVIQRSEKEGQVNYRFDASDDLLDLVNDFIKTERLCCPFFRFTLLVEDESVILTLSGPRGTVEFIRDEIGF